MQEFHVSYKLRLNLHLIEYKKYIKIKVIGLYI